jgi:anaerobic ribonucleoside-triphosphate reductase activating protein
MTHTEISLDLARCHFPVNGLGFGRRVGIWLQGCSIHCAGCIVPETWIAKEEHRTPLDGLLRGLLPWLDQADGVTISGGEPFDQPDSLHALLSALRILTMGDILIYSGYPWRRLSHLHSNILECCDVVISEPFMGNDRGDEPFIGSRNQQLHALIDG